MTANQTVQATVTNGTEVGRRAGRIVGRIVACAAPPPSCLPEPRSNTICSTSEAELARCGPEERHSGLHDAHRGCAQTRAQDKPRACTSNGARAGERQRAAHKRAKSNVMGMVNVSVAVDVVVIVELVRNVNVSVGGKANVKVVDGVFTRASLVCLGWSCFGDPSCGGDASLSALWVLAAVGAIGKTSMPSSIPMSPMYGDLGSRPMMMPSVF